jgi:carboxypeptidase Q
MFIFKKKLFMKKIVVLLLLISPALLFAQTEDSAFIKKMADEILTNGKAYENLRVLCKSVGARLSGSAGMYRAEDWAVKTLQAAGADKVYKQQCMVPHWVRGGKEEAYIEYKNKNGAQQKMMLDVLALGNSTGTAKNGIKAPLIMISNYDELEQKKDAVKGKIVFYSNGFNATNISTGKSYGESGVYRRSGPARAAKYGAVGVLIRSLSISTDNNPHTGATLYDSTAAKIPCAAMGLRDADKLTALLKTGTSCQAFIKTAGYFLPDTIGNNIIGEIKGTEQPEKIITIGGHLDSWDAAEGAHDDGTGCVHSIEVLRVMKAIGYKPKHTIRIVLFANEENGLRGGNKYAEVAKVNNEQHLFALESDAGGFTPRGFGFTGSEEQFAKLRSWLPLFLPYGVYQFTNGGGGADVGPLNKTFKTPVAGFDPDDQRYFDLHHARNDVFENVHKRELELGAINMAALIYLIDKYGL